MRFFKQWIGIALALVVATAVTHAAVQLEVDVSSQQIEVGESLQLRFTVTADSARPGEVEPKFVAPDFHVLGQNSSTSFSSSFDGSGMHTTSARTLIFELQPKQAGTLVIRGISVTVGSKVLTAADVSIRVGTGGTRPNTGGASTSSADTARGRAVWLETQVSNQHPVQGEQVVVSYVLYARTRVLGTSATAFPAFAGFLKEDLEMPMLGSMPNNEERVQGPNGEPLSRFVLAKFALYPLKSGKLPIEGFQVRAQVLGSGQRGRGDEEDDLFDSSLRQFFQTLSPRIVVVAAEPKTLEVSALPTPPAGFSNLVGMFELEGRIDSPTVEAGKPFTYTVVMRGRGQLSKLDQLPLTKLDGVEVFESKGHTRALGSGVSERVFETLYVPRNPGIVSIPELSLIVFDPEQKKYVTLSHPALSVQVTGVAAPLTQAPVPQDAGAGAGVEAPSALLSTDSNSSPKFPEALAFPKLPEKSTSRRLAGQPIWRWFAGISFLLAFGLLVAGIGEWCVGRWRRRRSRIPTWDEDALERYLAVLKTQEDFPEAFLRWRQELLRSAQFLPDAWTSHLDQLARLAEAARYAPPSERQACVEAMRTSAEMKH